ncbi:MAG: ankyrin repeat domain-containing protein [Paracoccaceae bacterium]|nr:ankyrin repeat domain-containing protein [Paracoccaceae bacterium]
MSSLDRYRREAKKLRRAFEAGEEAAWARVRAVLPEATSLRHTEALHVVAREAGEASWPKLKLCAEVAEMDREKRAERLKMALYFGQHWVTEALLSADPNLEDDNLGLQIALYRADKVAEALARDRGAATRLIGVRRPILHLAFSQHHSGPGADRDGMLSIAEMLVDAGADVNDGYPAEPGSEHLLSALYGALGHAGNVTLARWLLERGANPNDNESLYHSTELGHHEGLDLLLAHGADPTGTNALLRAMDFNDHLAVEKLLAAGADPNEGWVPDHPSGQPVDHVTALHQAARRMNDAKMARLLLDAGADPAARFDGLTPYEMARVYGNAEVTDEIAAAGGAVDLPPEIARLARIADGEVLSGEYIDPARLPDELRNMVRAILHQPGALDHVRRLIEAGLEWDRPDDMGLTPVQIAGWEGLPEVMAYFLSLKPDLSHINGYGGTLLSTIIHGSENCPERETRDHIGCARLALEEGVALPRPAIELAGQPEMAAFLADWGEAHPGQVTEDGIG